MSKKAGRELVTPKAKSLEELRQLVREVSRQLDEVEAAREEMLEEVGRLEETIARSRQEYDLAIAEGEAARADDILQSIRAAMTAKEETKILLPKLNKRVEAAAGRLLELMPLLSPLAAKAKEAIKAQEKDQMRLRGLRTQMAMIGTRIQNLQRSIGS